MQKKQYHYDEATCSFVPFEYNRRELFLHSSSLWILNVMILAGALLSLMSTQYGTPGELALKAENEVLLEQLEATRNRIENIEIRIDEIAKADNEMYRSILGLNTISLEERNAGTGGSRMYEEFDALSAETGDLLRMTHTMLDNLNRRVSIQQLSFDELKSFYNNNSERMRHIPAIKPVDNILISAYGMRLHPVLGYRRMHDGVDFRSEVGAPVYATGAGTISTASMSGTYGRLIAIDHDYGYETRYAHLSRFADGIRRGTKVNRGDLIGYTGRSGMVNGPHLHYEVWVNGEPVDPLMYLFANTTPEEYRMYQDLAATEHVSMD